MRARTAQRLSWLSLLTLVACAKVTNQSSCDDEALYFQDLVEECGYTLSGSYCENLPATSECDLRDYHACRIEAWGDSGKR